ncbi:MAG: formate/nitrite transporter family protein [Peptoanaerobacter stomatis]|uniref:formate/nitrite transporter family protein n=1 Tax=Peptoanaerobacter stomatis TaxID=796937 RepID=UPI003FA0B28E
MLSAKEVAEQYIELGEKKSGYPLYKMIGLAILAGIFIALASVASNTVSATVESGSIAKLLAGLVFPGGLIMVLCCGTELFTGDCLLVISLLKKKISLFRMLRCWFFVYIGNLIGSVIIAGLINMSGQLSFFNNELALTTIKVAVKKVSYTFSQGLAMGILCNILVCTAVIMAFSGKTLSDKVLGTFFPILLFILSGFEHCVANMYYIPSGMMALSNSEYVKMAVEHNIHIEKLNIGSFFINNLLPVTIGNIIGGAIFIGAFYWFLYLREEH